jgi:hypothetical protein
MQALVLVMMVGVIGGFVAAAKGNDEWIGYCWGAAMFAAAIALLQGAIQ